MMTDGETLQEATLMGGDFVQVVKPKKRRVGICGLFSVQFNIDLQMLNSTKPNQISK